ncbi:MFS transporter [Trinickia acidisoli]|uniref:MFS transporter n=1 Tax=Trinickia acidisoli TaxID=2767482 RepID=UPI001A8C6A88|nr:MFS transporter [Trinickia acidisoli]
MTSHLEASVSNTSPPSFNGPLAASLVIRITLVCFAVSMIDGFDTLMMSFVAPLLSKSLQIDHAMLGRVFSAGFVGTVIGSVVVGPAADRFGRRPMLLLALLVTGVFTLACGFATSATMLATLRFLGGLGMGGAIPPVTAITAESSPVRRRSTLVILMFIGFPLGAVAGGAISAVQMMRFGWPFVFEMGGACALLVLLLVWLVIPASVAGHRVATATMQGEGRRRLNPVVDVLADGRAAATFALWFGVLATMILSGFLVSFMPMILNMNGVPPTRAAFGSVLLNLGAIGGALTISALVGRRDPFRPVSIAFVGGAVLTFALGEAIGAGDTVLAMLFAVGAFLVGGQLTIPAMASRLFPPGVRAAGVGWTMAIGRLGSIIGPFVGGILLARQVPFERLFMMASVLAVCGAAGIALADRRRPRDTVAVVAGATTGASAFDIEGASVVNGKH